MAEDTSGGLIDKIADLIENKLTEKLNPIDNKLGLIDNSMTYVLSEIQKLNNIEVDVLELKSKVKNYESQVNNLKKENQKLEDQLLKMEVYMRKQNIKIWGIPEEKNENLEEKLLQKFAEVGFVFQPRDIIAVHRLGYYKRGSVRPVIVRFSHLKDKMLVFSKKDAFEGTGLLITQDYPQIVADRRRTILPIFFKALEKHNNQNPKLNVDKIGLKNDVTIFLQSGHGLVTTMNNFLLCLRTKNLLLPSST